MPEQFRPNEEEVLKMEGEKKEDVEFSEEEKIELNKILDNIQNFDFEKIDSIPDKYHKAIAIKLIEAGKDFPGGSRSILNLKGLDNEVAIKLIEAGKGDTVAHFIAKFKGIDHKEIALKIIEAGQGGFVAYNLKKFQNLDHKEIALKLFEAGQGEYVVCDFENFSNLDFQEMALKLIEAGQGEHVDKDINKLKGEFFDQCRALNLFPSELYIVKDNLENDDFKKLNKEEQSKYIYDKLKGGSKSWQDEENISGPFEEGAEYFGYDKMFKYLGMNDRHNTLYNFRKITNLARESGLKPEQFYGQILNQVKMDDAQYEEENDEGRMDALKSYSLLNNIADAVNISRAGKVIEKAKQYEDINRLQELVKKFEKKENICADWKNLRKYYELVQLLWKMEILDELKELKAQGKEELYKYIETLAFHPNVNMQKVMQFWRNPKEFLDVGEEHAPEAHDRKKPSNYVDIPHLDLTAENLRDGLVEGALDKLQSWQALEIDYKIGDSVRKQEGLSNEKIPLSPPLEKGEIKDEILKALGSKRKGIKGEAKDPNKLFNELNNIFKSHKLKLMEYLEGNLELPEEVKREIEEKLYDEKIGSTSPLSPPQRRGTERIRDEASVRTHNGVEYRVKINLKSDPDAVVAGNDTACCMPFGSGKNNVYTYNPVCSLFTVQKKIGDNWRTIAQSVLTKDIDVKKNVSEIISQMQAGMIKMDNLVDEDILTESERIITGDNIEVSGNFKENPEKDKILKYLYTDFFQEYVKRFGEMEKLDKDKMIIGKGYTDAMTNLEEVDNTYVPLAPVGYSDNVGEKALKLDLTKGNDNLALERKVNLQDKKTRKDLVPLADKKVEHLTFMDSLQVAYLEGKAYHDNKSLMEYLHNMENGLIAKDINNASKERVNLSLKCVDNKKKMQGYILAYEGKMDKKGEDIIYIADLAANPDSKMAGGRLIKEFIELYKKYYLDEGKLIPIVAEAREKTSYQIIMKQAEKMGKELGVKFRVEELGEKEKGEDTMHLVKITPFRKKS